MLTHPRRVASRRLRLIILALYAVTVGWTSVAHARGELLQASAAIESEHSEQCPTLHSDAICGVGYHAELATSARGCGPATAELTLPGPGCDAAPALAAHFTPSLARAPPSR